MRITNKLFIIPLLFSSLLITTFSCKKSSSDDDDPIGNWVRASDFDGNARSEAVVFTIGDKAYLTTGTTDRDRFKDLWEYDVAKKFWTQKADLPGTARNSAAGFAINNKGYVATGYDGVSNLKDVWQYDPVSNQWLQKNNFAGTARYDAVAFSIGTKGYISSGYDGNYLKDLWEYDAASDSWTQKASIGGSKRSEATAFVVNNNAYVCSGNNNGSVLNDLWMYDVIKNTWAEKRKLTDVSTDNYDDKYTSIVRKNCVSFIMNNLVYITTGENNGFATTTWEYDATTDLWTRKTSFEGSARIGAVAFTLNQKGFVLTGRSGSLSFDNSYEFQPTVKYEKND
jgi:N-acetylneuraminic acid mutarotase